MDDAEELKVALERIKSKGLGNVSEYHRELLKWTKNVDRRYAWVVLMALWFMMTATLGTYRIYGLIYAKITEDGYYSREEATWPVSTIFTVENVVGPFVSVIAYYISYRQSMIIGSLLLVLGNGLSTISSSLIYDILLLGVVQGIGYAFIFMPFMEIINSYFLRYRNLALGIALCGGTLSIFAWSPLFQWLLVTYEWRFSYLAIGCICCINLIMVPLLKPNQKPKPRSKLKRDLTPEGSQVGNERNTLSRLSIRALTYQNSFRRQSTIIISRQADDIFQRQASVISVNPFASSAGLERKISRTISIGNQDPQPQMQKQPSVMSHLSAAAEQYESVSLSEVGQDSEFEVALIWNVLRTPGFHLIWYNELLYFWVFSIYCLVMVDYGVDKGCSVEDAESLLSYQSIGELLGRLVLTIFVDMRFMSNKSIVILTLFILASLLAAVTHATGFIWMASITVAISAFASLLYVLLNGLLVDYLGENQVTLGYGMASCIGGVLMSFRPQAVGYFRDNHGTYDPLMFCLAVSCAIGGLLWMIEPLISRLIKGAGKGENCAFNKDSSA